jgi:hypothetical protein
MVLSIFILLAFWVFTRGTWSGFFILFRNQRATIPWILKGKPLTVVTGLSALPFILKTAIWPVVESTW